MQTAYAIARPQSAFLLNAPEVNPLLANLSKRDIPSLDGLRGVAALTVVVWHYLLPWKLSHLFPGPYAVTLFFELSGLLITWLILNEKERTGLIDKKHFYLRRAMRLFPVFYVVWGLCGLVGPFAGRWAYFFYFGDYYTAITHKYDDMTQAWSLGVEEKFYLLWPLLLDRIDRRKLIKLLICVLAAEPLYRLVLTSLGHEQYTWFAFDTHLDPIVLGCLIAILVKQGWRAPAWIAHPVTPICALVFIFLFQSISSLVTYLLAIVLISVIMRPPRILNNSVIRYFGLISYSLYLCHPYAASILWPLLFGSTGAHSLAMVLTSELVLTLAFASVLHFAIERPFLSLKRRLHPA